MRTPIAQIFASSHAADRAGASLPHVQTPIALGQLMRAVADIGDRVVTDRGPVG